VRRRATLQRAVTEDRAADAFRRWGYLQADLDPLGRLPPLPHPDLDALRDSRWRRAYCGPLGVEFMHLPFPDRVRWIQERLEADPPPVDPGPVLNLLLRGEVFEQTLQKRYPGTKRFSLEGMTALLPLLEEILLGASEQKAAEVLLGMTHRGRLNVMANIVGRRAREIFAGFEDVDPRSVLGGGDVKYHLGGNNDRVLTNGRVLRVSLTSNPSHLEAVDPVVLGRVRARQARRGGTETVVPVLLHGDAAFAGQGVASETLNLADLPAYSVGGTIHVVLDNLIGFTTTPKALHSSRYATDAARRLPVPIFHVNGEEPDVVVRAARLALAYRNAFRSDVVIDLVGYRRYGHSEIEDPTIVQPRLYRKIMERPSLARTYAAKRGLPTQETEEGMRRLYDQELDAARKLTHLPPLREMPAWWSAYRGGPYDSSLEVETAVPRERLAGIAERLAGVPPGFHLHPKMARLLDERRRTGRGEKPADWGTAEALALGSLLAEGVRVRLSGQDTRRGTFSHRHAVLTDTATEAEHLPLSGFPGAFECIDTPLSEGAPLGFEYGFSRDFPEALVLWEAQFGDFVNGAQVVVDQFVAAGEDKWGLLSGLVLLLPHGYEGQGPEHSTARPERFLQLAAEDNFEVVQPTTAAQYFHLLRRQVLRRWRKPLVVLTPKGLLRRPEAASPLADLSQGRFRPVLGDPDASGAERVILCTGKIAHELRAARKKDMTCAVLTLEKLYPFPEAELSAELSRHPRAREVVWVQEEPANMGALAFVEPQIRRLAGEVAVRSVKRSASAGPATGSMKAHALEQAALLALALGAR
jgi:2-oxoglutarate dehydrogenase E1 component